jgi:membrane associated rhomboid family serine protease
LLIVANFAVFIFYELPHPDLPGPDPGWIFLGLWFLYQFIEASLGLFSAPANGGGVAFFAHVGGFIFGLLVARLLARAGQAAPGEQWRSTA